ncbi:MAG: alpha-E domain-containing protein [Methylacidiphilales bacterium]|nr:alpha-E domain-containing protein [Candidatus Methylacidiphilales bacterium]MDW8349769.1 alpha-E domain-containing protein [Verrucomicrobiae bacterium]
MLSRVANCIYWMARYIERADNIARLVDVNLQLLLDYFQSDKTKLDQYWEPILKSLSIEEAFHAKYQLANTDCATDFLTFDLSNPSSIKSCIRTARENARLVRDQISTEIWEEINRLYHFVNAASAEEIWESSPSEFYRQIRQSSQIFQGLSSSTVLHDEAWEFNQIGKYLERADMTTRILDVKYHILLPRVEDVGGALDTFQWLVILRSTSAMEAYMKTYNSDVTPLQAAEFLILNNIFPRAVRFCIRLVDSALRRLAHLREGEFSHPVEKISGKLLAELDYSAIEDVFQYGLHEYLDHLQVEFNHIGEAMQQTYIYSPAQEMGSEVIWHQQQIQQQ